MSEEILEDQELTITIPFDEYIVLLGDRALLKELEKIGVTKMPMYDTAMLKTFLSTSRRFNGEEEVTRLKRQAKEAQLR